MPKVHMVMCYVTKFLDLTGETAGLEFYSEQAMESVHHDFKINWDMVKVNIDHPDFGEKLKDIVTKYNSLHL